jgi:hypothetical protein
MRKRTIITLAGLAVCLAFPPPAGAQATGRPCESVRAGGYSATHVFVDFMPCRSARAKLRRWLRRGQLPRNRSGWYCYRLSDVVRACSYPGKRNVDRSFTFWLRRVGQVQAAAPIRECGRAGTLYGGAVSVYNVTTRKVACQRARRFARRQILYGGPACREDRHCTYRGWRCTHFSYSSESDVRCTKPDGRVIRWQYGVGA